MPGCLVRAPDTMQVAIFGPKVLSPEMLVTLTHSSLSLGTAQAPREVTVSPTCSAPALPSSRIPPTHLASGLISFSTVYHLRLRKLDGSSEALPKA